MKKIVVSFLAAFFIFGAQQKTEAVGASDILDYVLGKAKDFTSKDKWQSSLCKQASFFGLKYSLRSADGVACKERNIGAFALALCSNYDDFKGSHCDKNARKKLTGDEKGDVDVATVLKDVVVQDTKKVGKLACMAATFIPEIGAMINIACEGVGL